MTKRIAPIAESAVGQAERRLFDLMQPGASFADVFNQFKVLVRHPTLMERLVPYIMQITGGALPPHDREILILRTLMHTRAPYLWALHVGMVAPRLGFTQADIARVADGPGAEGWSPLQSALIRAADDLHRDSKISDGVWAILAEHYTELQLMETPYLPGLSRMMSYGMSSLGVETDACVKDCPIPQPRP